MAGVEQIFKHALNFMPFGQEPIQGCDFFLAPKERKKQALARRISND
jgi:hypothetical protein